MTNYSLDGKVAIVTGSSSGIGKGIAAALANNGAHVVATSRTYERAVKVVEEIIRQGGRATPCSFDLEDHLSGEQLLDTVKKQLNRVDILVNNAISRDSITPNHFSELQYKNLTSGITNNLTNIMHLTSQAYPYLKATKGIVLNIGSVIVSRHVSGLLLYSIIKGGITRLTKGLASEWANDRIRVNQINPGFVETDSIVDKYPEKVIKDYKEQWRHHHPLGQIGTSEDIFELALYMVSDKARWMTGSVIDIDGGFSVQGVPFPFLNRQTDSEQSHSLTTPK
ncbi:MAG: SDR family oxidoreductase [Candidatus Electrothrix sp. AR5]|nr:SDR family oxidoreductase [Candidatus Electrothrix sp. AR5]